MQSVGDIERDRNVQSKTQRERHAERDSQRHAKRERQ